MAVAVVALFAVTAVAPPAAHAQFGGLVKRAAERLAKEPAAGKKEITDDEVAKLVAGFAEEARAADEIGRAALANHADVVSRVNGYLARKAASNAARMDAQARMNAYTACISGPSQQLAAAAQGQRSATMPAGAMALAQKLEAMSPAEREAFQQKMEALEKRAEAAKKSGDLAEQEHIRAELQQISGITVTPGAGTPTMSAANREKAQSAAAGLQKCGSAPAMSAAASQPEPEPVTVRGVVETNGVFMLAPVANQTIRDSADALAYYNRLRQMEVGNRPIERGAAAAGMSAGDYALQRERVLYFYALPASHGQAPRANAFSDGELEILLKHRAELVAAAKRLTELGLQ